VRGTCVLFSGFSQGWDRQKNIYIPISNNYQLATRVSPEAIFFLFYSFYLKRILNCIEAEMCRWYSIYFKKKDAFVTLIKVGSTAASSGVRHLLLHMHRHRVSAEGACVEMLKFILNYMKFCYVIFFLAIVAHIKFSWYCCKRYHYYVLRCSVDLYI
jgi:hypothetical protein